MQNFAYPLTTLIFLPSILAVFLLFVPKKNEDISKILALVGSTLVFIFSIYVYCILDFSQNGYLLLETKEWLRGIGTKYSVGIDGISVYLVLLTTFLIPLIVLSTWRAVEKGVREYLIFLLFLETAVLGAFLALDLFLFYIFWEAMLIPMFFLIGIWGGKERIYAAQKFMLYTFAGSVPMLIAIIYLVFETKLQLGFMSSSLMDIMKLNISADGGMMSPQALVFFAFFLAFAIKVPLFPFHTWLPDAHVQAPTGGSVILAGVLLKLGGYGLIRFAMPLAPTILPTISPYIMCISAIAIVYGACLAIAQTDIKKLVAYSSVSHMGYVILGLFALNEIGVTGAIYQMLNHGISTGALFLLVGILYERTHTRDISAYSGIAKTIPIFSIVMIIVTFSSIALPGTNGFIGEFLILQGSFLTNAIATIVAATGVILGAVYMLWLCQRILFGEEHVERKKDLTDINWREALYLAPFVILIIYMGVYPKPFLNKLEPAVKNFIAVVNVVPPASESGAEEQEEVKKSQIRESLYVSRTN